MLLKNNLLKKSIITFGFFGLILHGTASAVYDLKLYTISGFDYSKYAIANNIDPGDDVQRKGSGLLIPTLGIKFHDHFAIEGGYSFNKKITMQGFGEPEKSYKVRNVYLDLTSFISIIDQINIITGIGLGRLILQKGQYVDDSDIKNKFGWRVKVGVLNNFNDAVGLYTAINYQKASNRINDVKFIKNIRSIWIAMIYTI